MLFQIFNGSLLWWKLLLLGLPLFLLGATLHELAHKMVLSLGGVKSRLLPFPHWQHDEYGWMFIPKPWNNGKGWIFNFAGFAEVGDFSHFTKTQNLFLWVSPRISNTVVMTTVLLLFYILGYPPLQQVWILLAIAQIVDGFVGIVAIFCWWQDRDWTDIWRTYKVSGQPRWVIVVSSSVWFLLMSAVLLIPFA